MQVKKVNKIEDQRNELELFTYKDLGIACRSQCGYSDNMNLKH